MKNPAVRLQGSRKVACDAFLRLNNWYRMGCEELVAFVQTLLWTRDAFPEMFNGVPLDQMAQRILELLAYTEVKEEEKERAVLVAEAVAKHYPEKFKRELPPKGQISFSYKRNGFSPGEQVIHFSYFEVLQPSADVMNLGVAVNSCSKDERPIWGVRHRLELVDLKQKNFPWKPRPGESWDG